MSRHAGETVYVYDVAPYNDVTLCGANRQLDVVLRAAGAALANAPLGTYAVIREAFVSYTRRCETYEYLRTVERLWCDVHEIGRMSL